MEATSNAVLDQILEPWWCVIPVTNTMRSFEPALTRISTNDWICNNCLACEDIAPLAAFDPTPVTTGITSTEHYVGGSTTKSGLLSTVICITRCGKVVGRTKFLLKPGQMFRV